jgi:hypothetical protein
VTDDLEALRWELRCARQTIIDLMVDDVAAVLSSYVQHPPSRRSEWLEQTVDTLLNAAAALPRPPAPSASGMDRVYCPLCRYARQDPYAQGFAHPEGLRRHLTGDYGGQRCRVLAAAHALATQHWDGLAGEARASASIGNAAAGALGSAAGVAWRYQTGPECEGKLLSEHSGQARGDDELVVAEHRLGQLGFVCLRSARSIVSYTRAVDGHVIYADPRAAGTIWFHCYRRSAGRAVSGWEQRFPSFKLRDSGKSGVLDKFEAWLEVLLRSQLSPLPGPVGARVASSAPNALVGAGAHHRPAEASAVRPPLASAPTTNDVTASVPVRRAAR